MKVEKEVLDKMVKNLIENKEEISKIYSDYISKIKNANSVEEVMDLKKKLLYELIQNLPMGCKHCYFCIKYYDSPCEECEYADYHGTCISNDSLWNDLMYEFKRKILKADLSDYEKINLAYQLFASLVNSLYYSEERY